MTPPQPYRYTLERGPWLNGEGTVLFVMLNPSTADDTEDDPTIRRCIGFAQSWGYERLVVGNLYALRATDPRELFGAVDPIGPENDLHLEWLARHATEVVVAWGSTPHPTWTRELDVLALLRDCGHEPVCLGQTLDHRPRHPLYVKRDHLRESIDDIRGA